MKLHWLCHGAWVKWSTGPKSQPRVSVLKIWISWDRGTWACANEASRDNDSDNVFDKPFRTIHPRVQWTTPGACVKLSMALIIIQALGVGQWARSYFSHAQRHRGAPRALLPNGRQDVNCVKIGSIFPWWSTESLKYFMHQTIFSLVVRLKLNLELAYGTSRVIFKLNLSRLFADEGKKK